MIDKAREIALKTLYNIEQEKAYSNIELEKQIKSSTKILNEKDIGLISQIVYGVTTWRLTLDTIIEKYSKIKLKKISIWIINILRMGIYQIIFLDKIPKSAAVNESVNLAKRYGHKTSSNFVNAILRKITIEDYKELFNIEDKKERISKTQAMPVWIIEELLKNNTIEEVEEICKNLNLMPQISIRVNKLKTTKEELKKKLEEKGITCEDGILDDFIITKNIKNIEKIEEFKNGLFTVQDESAGLAALMLAPKKNEKVLDACSAPGGKTTYLAEMMENDGKIEAWDIYEHRINLIEENCKRLGISIVKTKLQDASEASCIKEDSSKLNQDEPIQKYDKILLDVPCLGIGVIKRKPDIKWQRKLEDVQEISKLQFDILQNCSRFLKSGGELVYSTCSILKEENEDVIEKFINLNSDFEIITKNEVNEKFKNNLKEGKYLDIKPSKEQDGFFICKLRKK